MKRPRSDFAPLRWEIFCAVVDNLGDVGVCWRLARQLAAEHGAQVRLWVDDLVTLRRLLPAADAAADAQSIGGVEVRRWATPFVPVEAADVVVETFGCDLPQEHVAAMKARPVAPVWVNLEYLSAESWVGRCHGLPSPQPPLTKYFYFPGFSADTGGVLKERGLEAARDAFQSRREVRAAFLDGLGLRDVRVEERLVSLFCYPHAPVPALLDALAADERPARIISFADTPGAQALVAAGLDGRGPRGRLSGAILPFLSQDDYDRVLWACDWNVVRGEDSFVRAQWAARPFVWQAYPQRDDAHRLKVQSFLARYLGAATMDAGNGLADLWYAWNGLGPASRIEAAWAACAAKEQELRTIAVRWATHLGGLGDLARNLARFCAERYNPAPFRPTKSQDST